VNPSAQAASLAATVLVLAILWYVLACAVAPWGRCRKCRGIGRKTTRTGKLTRAWCRRCNGTGRRVRVGRRIWTWINHEYREGHR
jgi:hypothetical protein